MAITKVQIEKMKKKATLAMKNAFSVNSNHKIGACILTKDGKMFPGCNVENSISGLGSCAERNAINTAVANGHYSFQAIVIVDQSGKPVFPCGMCLQYLLEFSQIAKKDIKVIMSNEFGKDVVSSVRKLLPHGYYTDGKKHHFEEYTKKNC
jgi:cytidine deaminase